MQWFREVKPGDVVMPLPLWNQTERKPNHLASATKVLEVKEAVSQTGILFKVASLNGQAQWLDAGWFIGKQTPQGASHLGM